MSLITTYALDACTVEFGPDFPPSQEASAAWHAVAQAFLLDRFATTGAWVAADWERTGDWPFDIDGPAAYVLNVNDSEVRIARRARVDAEFARAVLASAGFGWDGMLLISGDAGEAQLETYVRLWFASMNTRRNELRSSFDAVYPVVDGFGLRYTNAAKSIEALTGDVERVVGQTLSL